MPVYEYVCTGCDDQFDRILNHAEADNVGPCEACGEPIRRRFSRVAVKLEGWGFAKNDAMIADRPGGRNDFKQVKERAEKLSDTGSL